MKIESVEGHYYISWYAHHDVFCEAREWCKNQFGDNWGWASSGQLDRYFGSLTVFTFKRLYHAQWFLMRWEV
jgi:hypothetical protein